MIKKQSLIVLLFSIVASIAILLNAFYKRSRNSSLVRATTFHAAEGWGYDILVDDTLFIHQASIPCINGKQGFSEKEQAEKTAALIINKIKKRENPVVTIFELQKIIPVKEFQQYAQGTFK